MKRTSWGMIMVIMMMVGFIDGGNSFCGGGQNGLIMRKKLKGVISN